jgi:hypothetical protein
VRKNKTVIRAAQAVPATRAPLRFIVGIIVLLVGMAAWKAATHSSKANSIVAAFSPVPVSSSPNTIINEIAAHEDMIPPLLAAAGDTLSRKSS